MNSQSSKSTRRRVALLVVATLAIIVAWLTQVRVTRARNAAAEISHELNSAAVRLRTIRTVSESARNGLASTAREREVPDGRPFDRSTNKSPEIGLYALPQSPVSVMQTNPTLQRQALSFAADRVAVEYAALFAKLGLSSEEAGKFIDARLHLIERTMDLAAVKARDPLAAQSTALLQQQYSQEFESSIKQLLGPARYAEEKEYERTLPLRTAVAQALADSSLTGGAADADRAERLVELLAGTNSFYLSGRTAAFSAQNWDATLAALPPNLAPADIYAVKKTIQRIQNENRLNLILKQRPPE